MAEIRSALEIALEKAERLGAANKNEAVSEELFNKGRRLAARYINGEEKDLTIGLKDIKKEDLPHVINGAIEIILRNIILPRDKDQWSSINRAFSGIIALKGSPVKEIVSQIEQLLKTYEVTKKRYYDQLKAQMQGRLGGIQQSLAKQYGTAIAASINIETLPEFQNEWSKLSSDINEQFNRHLQQLKAYLAS
ncbi:MAG: hypothetical protein ACP5J5_03425 [Dissulfurimicrobium sp.]|uniref:hypothetical protein n=1 Tax=Dissulfurimicrobium hydrothermale TaxID=1750598 RepID=UPI001EDBFEE4|nr:hypothetical protein [Dissulfurimicrobium hydrothermale]UKL13268.1 hypothetical protein LGS26_07205 [Dissulfurimicrobium hydrothermale]